MSKVLAAATAVVGSSSIALGGAYLIKNGNGTGAEVNTELQEQESTIAPTLSFSDLNTFKNAQGGECVKNFFTGLNFSEQLTQTDTSNLFDTGDLSTTASGATHPKSCLIINWEKNGSTDTQNNKGNGNFRWLGSFVNGDKGFVIFYTTKPYSENKKLDLEAGIYFVSEEGTDTKTGKVKKYKEVSDTSKNISKSTFDESFPQNDERLNGLEEGYKTNGGFVKDKNDFENLCKSGDDDCPQDSQTNPPNLKGVWNGQVDNNSGSSTPDKGNKKFTENLKYLFGQDNLDMSSALVSFKGSGKKQNSAGN